MVTKKTQIKKKIIFTRNGDIFYLKTHQFHQITKIFTKIGDKKSTKLGAIIVTRIGEIFVT